MQEYLRGSLLSVLSNIGTNLLQIIQPKAEAMSEQCLRQTSRLRRLVYPSWTAHIIPLTFYNPSICSYVDMRIVHKSWKDPCDTIAGHIIKLH